MAELLVRLASERDIEEIVALIRANLDKLLPRSIEDARDLLPTTWVVEVDGRIDGVTILEVYSPKIAEIRSVVVRQEERGKGYGHLLVQAAVEEAKKRGVREIITVTSSVEFFEQLNFGACLDERYALFYNGSSGPKSGV